MEVWLWVITGISLTLAIIAGGIALRFWIRLKPVKRMVPNRDWVTAALRASEARFRAMNEASPLGIFVTEPDGDCAYTNSTYQKIVGYSFDELLGTGWINAVHPEDRDRVFKAWYQATLEKPFHFEIIYRNLHPDGRTIWLSVKAAEMRDDEHEYGYVGSIDDITALKTAQLELEISERKYRHLVENSDDIIFSLDERGNFLTVSKALRTHLGRKPEMHLRTSFLDLVYAPEGEDPYTRYGVMADHLKEVWEKGSVADFTIDFATGSDEPYELKVRLERINLDGTDVIYGKASRITQDVLLKHCRNEIQTYEIGNSFTLAEALARRLTAKLALHLQADELAGVKLGIREMLINAIEHGNLDITFEEKTTATQAGTLGSLIQERRHDPERRDRKVQVDYALQPGLVEFTIRDQGAGFNFREMETRDVKSGPDFRLLHGRGIALTRDVFDKVEYRGTGNQVRLSKQWQQNGSMG